MTKEEVGVLTSAIVCGNWISLWLFILFFWIVSLFATEPSHKEVLKTICVEKQITEACEAL